MCVLRQVPAMLRTDDAEQWPCLTVWNYRSAKFDEKQ